MYLGAPMGTELEEVKEVPALRDRKVGKSGESYPLNTSIPLLDDKDMRSVVSMIVRPNECDQSLEGGRAVRHWYEQNLHQERIITKAHQRDVALLLSLIEKMAADHGLSVPVEAQRFKQQGNKL